MSFSGLCSGFLGDLPTSGNGFSSTPNAARVRDEGVGELGGRGRLGVVLDLSG